MADKRATMQLIEVCTEIASEGLQEPIFPAYTQATFTGWEISRFAICDHGTVVQMLSLIPHSKTRDLQIWITLI